MLAQLEGVVMPEEKDVNVEPSEAAAPERPNPHASALAALGAAKGGHARAARLTPERRKEIAAKGAAARWRGDGAIPVRATHTGTVKIGDMKLECANLPGGTRVVSEAAILRALGRGYSGYYSKRDAAAAEGGAAVMPRYVAPLVLRSFIDKELSDLLSRPTPYMAPTGDAVFKGIDAQALPKICRVWLDARKAGKLSNQAQRRAADMAEMLMSGLATVGIVALVDEATGFQDIRDQEALQAMLDRYLRKELAAWAKRFPDEFYEQIFRLRGWQWKGRRVNPPQALANYTKDLVYARLAPGLLRKLEEKNPINSGRRKAKHFQWLTEDIGEPALSQHLYAVVTLLKVSQSWDDFKRMLDSALPKRGETLKLPIMT